MTVYYLRADNGAIKIGYSTNVQSRLSSISTASPLGLELVAQEKGGLKIEGLRHEQFREDNIRGEWFYPSENLNRHIKTLNPNYQPSSFIDRDGYEQSQSRLKGVESTGSSFLLFALFIGLLGVFMVAYAVEVDSAEAFMFAPVVLYTGIIAAAVIKRRLKKTAAQNGHQ